MERAVVCLDFFDYYRVGSPAIPDSGQATDTGATNAGFELDVSGRFTARVDWFLRGLLAGEW